LWYNGEKGSAYSQGIATKESTGTEIKKGESNSEPTRGEGGQGGLVLLLTLPALHVGTRKEEAIVPGFREKG